MRETTVPQADGSDGRSSPVAFRDAVALWAKVGLLGFGGPAGQIALMHRLVVEERRWIGEAQFLHALNFCMLLPGPEAQQLATYIGWLMHGARGGLAAGILFVLPGAIVVLALSMLYALFQDLIVVQALFFGIKAAVLAIVAGAVHRIARRALKGALLVTIAVAAFIAIFLFGVPFPVVVVGAAAIGALAATSGFLPQPAPKREGGDGHAAHPPAGGYAAIRPSWRHAAQVLATGLLLWLGPLMLIRVLLGSDHLFAQQGLFFSKMALVTFGGAYAVLSYVAQAAVESYGWLTAPEMLDGLGLAETTPGPLILVLQFVGFIAAYRMPGALDPLLAGTLGSVIVLWATFAPCFLWIFLGAPYVEALRGRRVLDGALSAITAAVVGVIANLAVWFALHVLFAELREMRAAGMVFHLPVWSSLDPAAAILAAGALVAVLGMRAGLMPTLLGCGILGLLFRLVVN